MGFLRASPEAGFSSSPHFYEAYFGAVVSIGYDSLICMPYNAGITTGCYFASTSSPNSAEYF